MTNKIKIVNPIRSCQITCILVKLMTDDGTSSDSVIKCGYVWCVYYKFVSTMLNNVLLTCIHTWSPLFPPRTKCDFSTFMFRVCLLAWIPNTMKILIILPTAKSKSKQVNSIYLINVFRKQTNTSKSYWHTQNQQNLKSNVAYYIFLFLFIMQQF